MLRGFLSWVILVAAISSCGKKTVSRYPTFIEEALANGVEVPETRTSDIPLPAHTQFFLMIPYQGKLIFRGEEESLGQIQFRIVDFLESHGSSAAILVIADQRLELSRLETVLDSAIKKYGGVHVCLGATRKESERCHSVYFQRYQSSIDIPVGSSVDGLLIPRANAQRKLLEFIDDPRIEKELDNREYVVVPLSISPDRRGTMKDLVSTLDWLNECINKELIFRFSF